MPNVYKNLQNSFLSLAWPWSGRSLPKGNQWECWDPGQGPLSGLGEVGHSPKETSRSAGTLDWGPMWSGSQPTCHPNVPCHPYIPCQPPNAPSPLPALQYPWCPYTFAGPLTPCWPSEPLHPMTPPAMPLMALHHMLTPDTPWCSLHHCQWECWAPGLGPNVIRLPVQLPPCNAPWHPQHPLLAPNTPSPLSS